MNDYQLEQAKEQGRQEVWRRIVLIVWLIIFMGLAFYALQDALIDEYSRSTANTTSQTSTPIYRIEADGKPQFTVQPTVVPTVPSLQQGTTVNKPGKP